MKTTKDRFTYKKMIKSTRNGYCDHVQDIRN